MAREKAAVKQPREGQLTLEFGEGFLEAVASTRSVAPITRMISLDSTSSRVTCREHAGWEQRENRLLVAGSGLFVHEMTLILLLDFNLIFQRSTSKEAPPLLNTQTCLRMYAGTQSKSTALRGSSPETVSPAR